MQNHFRRQIPIPAINITPEVIDLIRKNAPVAIGVSGGKDSQAAAIATVTCLRSMGHLGPIILIHADLGVIEWKDSLRVCQDLASHLNLELVIVRRNAGDMLDRWRSRWQSSVDRYETLRTITLVLPWSTPGMRFCTSEMKTHIIQAYLKKRWPGQTILNVTGVRAEESPSRAKKSISETKSPFVDWRPILSYKETEVFHLIESSGLALHPAYREYGLSRVSCSYCIMMSLPDLMAATRQNQTHAAFRFITQLECESGFGFQGQRWLSDLRPDLIDPEVVLRAKELAAVRQIAEARLPKSLLFVKGWPTTMPSRQEAVILADVRKTISSIYSFNARHTTPDSVLERYKQLLDEKARKLTA